MINKQKIWFATLFCLILVLSIYYLAMPDDLLKQPDSKSVIENNSEVVIEESEVLTALRVENDEQVIKEMNSLQEILLDETKSVDEKNDAFELLKKINDNKGMQEKLEKKIKDNFKLDNFIKIDNNTIRVVISSNEHNRKIANDIIRSIQEEYETFVFITVTFK